MADSINAQISDRLIERQLQVGRVEAGLRREVFAQLALLESEILSSIKSNDPTDFALLTRRRLEVQRLMANEIDPLVTERYQHIADLLDAAMMRVARNEAVTVQTIVNSVTQEQIIEEEPPQSQLRAGVVHGIFPSPATAQDFATTGNDWWKRQSASLTQRLHDQLTVGVSLEENITELARRVKGTSENAFTDGVMARARNDASRLLTTQMTHTIGEARVAVAERNTPQLMLVHQSILDSRVSTICLSRHGLKFTSDTHEGIGHSIPYLSGIPYHPS